MAEAAVLAAAASGVVMVAVTVMLAALTTREMSCTDVLVRAARRVLNCRFGTFKPHALLIEQKKNVFAIAN